MMRTALFNGRITKEKAVKLLNALRERSAAQGVLHLRT
jgi:hypothetical protein